jgi:hypothetical protein
MHSIRDGLATHEELKQVLVDSSETEGNAGDRTTQMTHNFGHERMDNR